MIAFWSTVFIALALLVVIWRLETRNYATIWSLLNERGPARWCMPKSRRVIPNERHTDVDTPSPIPEAIVAWRAWRLRWFESGPALESLVVDVTWPCGEALEARDIVPPGRQTTYGPGIYAAKTRYGARNAMGRWTGTVFGTVALWGNVVEHQRGYRAQFAYPQYLWCPDVSSARELRRRYGCETDVMPWWSGLNRRV